MMPQAYSQIFGPKWGLEGRETFKNGVKSPNGKTPLLQTTFLLREGKASGWLPSVNVEISPWMRRLVLLAFRDCGQISMNAESKFSGVAPAMLKTSSSHSRCSRCLFYAKENSATTLISTFWIQWYGRNSHRSIIWKNKYPTSFRQIFSKNWGSQNTTRWPRQLVKGHYTLFLTLWSWPRYQFLILSALSWVFSQMSFLSFGGSPFATFSSKSHRNLPFSYRPPF